MNMELKPAISCALLISVLFGVASGMCQERRIELEVDGWILIGDFCLPASDTPIPAVIMLNKAKGDRSVYARLAGLLNERGIATLRIDLRAHGESINLGVFEPSEGVEILQGTENDIAAVDDWIKKQPGINPSAIGYIGASYSAELMTVVGRAQGYAEAYVCLSGGSFSDESINAMDSSGKEWWHIVSKHERYMKEIIAEVKSISKTAKVTELEGNEHATDLLKPHPELEVEIADWLAERLK